jgi:5-methylcytosine-specific restriction protein A
MPSTSQGTPRRNPAWVRDELILALDVYLRHAGNLPPKGSPEIAELSEMPNRLGRYLGIATQDRFRNLNGAYIKLGNFRRFDPAFEREGKRGGLTHGNREEEAVWNEFASDPHRCHAVAEAIRRALADAREGQTIAAEPAEPEIAEAEERRVVTAMHRARERNLALIRARKQRALAQLVCRFRNIAPMHQAAFLIL